jgi:hypothetical protein
VLEALPRRVTLTLPELRLVAERAGGAPLPFELTAPRAAHALEDRLGQSRTSAADEAYAAALASLHDPEESLTRRGLLGEVGEDSALVGAVGLLATPQTAVDIDVTATGIQARSWHRRAGNAVAALSTVDGIVFELAWFHAGSWPDELARAAILPEDCVLRTSAVPDFIDVPFALADAASEATRTGRDELVPVLTDQADGTVLDRAGVPLDESEVATVLTALSAESCGRLRVLVADLSGGEPTVVGVVSWTLLADGWHALRPRETDGRQRVQVAAVQAADLPTELAPVLAEVTT